MKRILSILFITVAVVLLQTVVILPHHHHGDTVCMVKSHCTHDCAANDEHGEHDTTPTNNSSLKCVAESDYFISRTNNENNCSLSSCDEHNHFHFFAAFLVVEIFPRNNAELSTIPHKFKDKRCFYQSVDTYQPNGLRAPPCYLS